MPVKKTHLSRRARSCYLARARKLQAAQIECKVPDDWRENSHDLHIFTSAPA